MMSPRLHNTGFTLVEVLLAVTLLAVILAMVYAAFASVTKSTDAARISMEELRTRQFLERALSVSFTSIYVDPYYENELFRFYGEDGSGSGGPADAIRFCSTAPVVGGMALPGDIKEVILEVGDPDQENSAGVDSSDEKRRFDALMATETPRLAAQVEEADESGHFEPTESYESAQWQIPAIRSLDIQYFDGEDWVEEWDSLETQRLPWGVHIRVNFAKTEAQQEAERSESFSVDEDPDFEMYIPLPTSIGLTASSPFVADLMRMSSESQANLQGMNAARMNQSNMNMNQMQWSQSRGWQRATPKVPAGERNPGQSPAPAAPFSKPGAGNTGRPPMFGRSPK